MTPSQATYLLLAVAPLVAIAALIGLQFSSAASVYFGASARRPRNVTIEKRVAPATVAKLIAELSVLGFQRLGETEVTVPDIGLIGSLLRRQQPHTAWVMVDEPATTSAVIIAIRPHLSLETWLADRSVVQTTFMAGEKIDEPALRSAVVRTDVAETYRTHRLLVDERASRHGAPGAVHSIGDYLRDDAEYRRRFARRYLRRLFITRHVLPAVVLLVAAVLLAYTALPRPPGG